MKTIQHSEGMRFLGHWSGWRLLGALGVVALAGSTAQAQSNLAADAAEEEIEEIVVTGSLIRGTPIDTESPVTILNREELERQGLPSVVEMIRRLSASSGIEGETNQFQSNGSEGLSNINLRGLGPQRTLVLLNGKRQAPVPQRLPGGRYVDVNSFPAIAIQRVEVLKEGAAATYGSDAIGGVVNFLTRDDFTGLEISGSLQTVAESDGDQAFGIIAGQDFGGWHVVGSFGIQNRSELQIRDLDFLTSVEYGDNEGGGWSSIGNPGVFFLPAAVQATVTTPEAIPAPLRPFGPFAALHAGLGGVKDPNCDLLGGLDNSLFCRFRFTDFDNLIETEDRTQLFVEVNREFASGMNLHGEIMLSTVDVPDWATSPSYPPQALFGNIQHAPSNHPGLLDMADKYPTLFGNRKGAFGSYIDLPLIPAVPAVAPMGDNPGIDEVPEVPASVGAGATFYGRIQGTGAAGPRRTHRDYETFRMAFTLDGELEGGIGWDFGFTWSTSESNLGGVDAEIGRTLLAFNGYGGEDCPAFVDPETGMIDVNGAVQSDTISEPSSTGCYWYNPFSNSIRTSNAALTEGAVNPDFEETMANSAAVLDYLDDVSNTNSTANFMVLDLLFQGEIFDGDGAWGAGYQYRSLALETSLDERNNLVINPCRFPGQTVDQCPNSRTGLRSFLAGADPIDDSQTVHSFFGELAWSLLDNLDLQIGARFEDYGDTSTFDPKVAVRWGIADWVTLRGSTQTTFRGPDIDAVSSGRVTALSFVDATGAFKAIDVVGNPNVDPEEALTYNIGVIFDFSENFTLTLDYWTYDFDNPIIVEPSGALANAFASTDPAVKAAVQDQIFCTGGTNDGNCTEAAIERIETLTINGPSIQTSGLDIYLNYSMDAGPGVFSLGLDFSQISELSVDAWVKNGVQIDEAYDAVGQLNKSRGDNRPFPRPLPELKGRIFFEYAQGGSNYLFFINHITSYEDERYPGTATAPVSVETIEAQTTFDFHYRINLLDERFSLTASAINLTDEEPPLAQTDLSYDAYTHNPFGTMLKIGARYRFGGN